MSERADLITSETRAKVQSILDDARLQADVRIRREIADYAVAIATQLGERIAVGEDFPHARLVLKAGWASFSTDPLAELAEMMPDVMLTRVEYTTRGKADSGGVNTEWYAHTCTPRELRTALDQANNGSLVIRLPTKQLRRKRTSY